MCSTSRSGGGGLIVPDTVHLQPQLLTNEAVFRLLLVLVRQIDYNLAGGRTTIWRLQIKPSSMPQYLIRLIQI